MDLGKEVVNNFTKKERAALALSGEDPELTMEVFKDVLTSALDRNLKRLDGINMGRTEGHNPAMEKERTDQNLIVLQELAAQLLNFEMGDDPLKMFGDSAA